MIPFIPEKDADVDPRVISTFAASSQCRDVEADTRPGERITIPVYL